CPIFVCQQRRPTARSRRPPRGGWIRLVLSGRLCGAGYVGFGREGFFDLRIDDDRSESGENRAEHKRNDVAEVNQVARRDRTDGDAETERHSYHRERRPRRSPFCEVTRKRKRRRELHRTTDTLR